MIVTLNSLQKDVQKVSKAGKPYTAHVLNYTNGNGKTMDKMIFPNDPVAQQLESVTPGDHLDVTTTKENYNGRTMYKWVAVSKTNEAPKAYTGNSGGNSSGGGYSKPDSMGLRVGNLTTNATTLVAGGKAETLQQAVDMLLQVQSYIEDKLKAPTTTPAPVVQKVEPTITQQLAQPVSNNDYLEITDEDPM